MGLKGPASSSTSQAKQAGSSLMEKEILKQMAVEVS